LRRLLNNEQTGSGDGVALCHLELRNEPVAIKNKRYVMRHVREITAIRVVVKSFFVGAVDHRQLRSELRAEQDPDGDLGDSGGASADVGRLANHEARVQGDLAEQEDNSSRPGPVGHPRKAHIQGERQTNYRYRCLTVNRFETTS
jgi:hypothetical protein